jgi:hypothetical protein
MEVRVYDGKDSTFTLFEDDRIDDLNPSRTSTIIRFFLVREKPLN